MIRGAQALRNEASLQQSKMRHVRCLLIAPGISAFFGISISPKFFVLALIYLIAAAVPLVHTLKVLQTSNNSELETLASNESVTVTTIASTNPTPASTKSSPRLTQMVNDAIRTQRSITLQFALLGICLFVYEQSRVAVVKRKETGDSSLTHAAFRSAWEIINFEHYLKLDFEPAMQKMFQWMSPVGNVYYAIMHFVAPASIMGSLILQNRDPRFQYRLSFFLMLLLALIIFTLVPTMPPRLLSRYQHEYMTESTAVDYAAIGLTADEMKQGEDMMKPYWKIVDTMAKGGTIYNSLHGEVGNPYAAMPSMHTGWALWSALVTIETAAEKYKRMWTILGLLHVALTVFFIIVTGNHFWLDAAAGALCVYFGLFSARFLTGEFVARKMADIGRGISSNLPLFMKEWLRACEAYFFVPTHFTQDEKVEEVPV
mmetsp:Transcript_28975/g.44552  ORF Transcript_28975/g.44552 Transcript_28975/m.44552 type:complete len:429 (+) Transcript_28975:112-1398(+)